MSSTLEKFYNFFPNNVVLRDVAGNPSIFIRHPKMNSSDFDPILPNHTHPAFIVGEEEDDAVLISKYQGSRLVENGSIYSLPNAVPIHLNSANGTTGMSVTETYASSHIPTNEHDIGYLTIADWGLLTLIAHKFQIEEWFSPSWYGSYISDADIVWNINQNINVGQTATYHGYLWKCLIAHTTSTTLNPIDAPFYWEKIKRIGATPADYDSSGRASCFMTGSGPVKYYLNNDMGLEADLIGYGQVALRGIKIVGGEINILPNNDAADPSINLNTTNKWRAIKPHGINDANNADGTNYDLVTPGTSGTVHWTTVGSGTNKCITFFGRNLESSEFDDNTANTDYEKTVVDADSLPNVPCILYELGLLPLPNTTLYGYNQGRCSSSSGATRYITALSGTSLSNNKRVRGFPYIGTVNSSTDNSLSARLRAREKAST